MDARDILNAHTPFSRALDECKTRHHEEGISATPKHLTFNDVEVDQRARFAACVILRGIEITYNESACNWFFERQGPESGMLLISWTVQGTQREILGRHVLLHEPIRLPSRIGEQDWNNLIEPLTHATRIGFEAAKRQLNSTYGERNWNLNNTQ